MTEKRIWNYIVTVVLTVALIGSSFAMITPVFAENNASEQATKQEQDNQGEKLDPTEDAEKPADSENVGEPAKEAPSAEEPGTENPGTAEEPGTEEPGTEEPAEPAEDEIVVDAPKKVSISYNYSKNQATISWTKVKGATSYNLYYKKSNKVLKKNLKTNKYVYKKTLKFGKHVFYVEAVRKETGEDGTEKTGVSEKTTGTYQQKYLTEKVRTYSWKVVTTKKTTLYRFSSGASKAGTVAKGTTLYVWKKFPSILPWYKYPKRIHAKLYKNGKVVRSGWVKWGEVPAPTANLSPKIKDGMRQQWAPSVAEKFVNKKGYTSKTKYLAWANLYTQRVYIFKGKKGHWKLIKAQKEPAHSTGKYRTYRIESGRFLYRTRIAQMSITGHKAVKKNKKPRNHKPYYYKKLSYVYLTNSFHSTSWLIKNNKVSLGMSKNCRPSTHGCMRMDLTGAAWLYDNVPIHSRVVVY